MLRKKWIWVYGCIEEDSLTTEPTFLSAQDLLFYSDLLKGIYYVNGEVATSEISRPPVKENFKQTFLRVFQLILLNVGCWPWGPGSRTAVMSHQAGDSVAWGKIFTVLID